MRELVRFKGNRDGLTVILDPHADFSDLLAELERKLEAAGSFLEGAAVSVDLGNRDLQPGQLSALENVFLSKNMRLRRVMAGPSGARGVASLLEGSVSSLEKSPSLRAGEGLWGDKDIPVLQYRLPARRHREDLISQEQTILIQRTVRSGQRIFYPGNVVVLGDVNPGAEIIAGGNIIVMGTFRGVAHAGAFGDENAVVAAIRLEPSQLRIAGYVTRAPEGDFSSSQQPEVARVQDGIVIIEKYQPGFDWHSRGQGKGGS